MLGQEVWLQIALGTAYLQYYYGRKRATSAGRRQTVFLFYILAFVHWPVFASFSIVPILPKALP